VESTSSIITAMLRFRLVAVTSHLVLITAINNRQPSAGVSDRCISGEHLLWCDPGEIINVLTKSQEQFIIRFEAKLQPNIVFTLWGGARFGGFHAFGYNSAKMNRSG